MYRPDANKFQPEFSKLLHNQNWITSHKMIVTVLKIYLQKREAKVINYRDYQNFSNEEFRQQVLKDILKAIQNGHMVSYEFFLSIC